MDTEDTLSLPESLRREYHDLRTKVAEEKKPREVSAEDEGMKLQENDADGNNDEDDNASVCSSSTLSGSSSCGDVEELFSDSGLESGGSVDDVNLAAAAAAAGGCGRDCFCATIREWLGRMADRNDCVGNLDESWREEKNQKETVGPAAATPRDLSKYNLDPYPTLSRESYRYKHVDEWITQLNRYLLV